MSMEIIEEAEGTYNTNNITMKAARNINKFIEEGDSGDLRELGAEEIRTYLYSNLIRLEFGQQLKRYLFRQYPEVFRGIKRYDEADEGIYKKLITQHWDRESGGGSITAQTAERWIRQRMVKREGLFLIALGLHMPEMVVSKLLQDGLRERDFDLKNDPTDCAYWYCICHGLSKQKAEEYQKKAEEYQDGSSGHQLPSIGQLRRQHNESAFLLYLAEVTARRRENKTDANTWEIFEDLFESAYAALDREDRMIARNDEEDFLVETIESKSRDGVLERYLYQWAIPRKENGTRNLVGMKESDFYYDNILEANFHRLDRQRLSLLHRRKTPVSRYDLLTLQFILSSKQEEEDPLERCLVFRDEANRVLDQCHMAKIYPPNPYETMLMLCLLTADPLMTYCSLWDESYKKLFD